MPEAKRPTRPASPTPTPTPLSSPDASGEERGVGTNGRTATLSQPVSEVFLSPRVIDREAFNDYAGSLRRLIEQSADRGDALRAATAEADAAHQQLRDLATRHTARFELAAKAMAGLDERSAKAEQMLLAVQQAALSLDTFRAEAAEIVNASAAAGRARLEEDQALAEARLRETLDRAEAVERRLAAVAADTERVVAEREALMEQRAEAVMGRWQGRIERAAAEAHARAEAARIASDSLTQRLDTFSAVVDSRLVESRQSISGCEARAVQSIEDAAAGARRAFDGVCETLSTHADELRESLASAANAQEERIIQIGDATARRADEAASQIAAAADAAGAQAEEHHERLADILIRVEESAGEAETLLGLTQPLPNEEDAQACEDALRTALPGSLGALVLRARAARSGTDAALTRLESMQAQTEQARSILGSDLLTAASQIDQLAARADALKTSVEASVKAGTEAEAALTQRREALHEAAAAPLAELQRRGDDLRRQIDAMEAQTTRAREVTRGIVEQTTTVVRGLSATLSQLKPWQPLLLEHDPNEPLPELPAALQRVVDQVRSEIASDLGTVAAGLSQLASRAQRISEQTAPHAAERVSRD